MPPIVFPIGTELLDLNYWFSFNNQTNDTSGSNITILKDSYLTYSDNTTILPPNNNLVVLNKTLKHNKTIYVPLPPQKEEKFTSILWEFYSTNIDEILYFFMILFAIIFALWWWNCIHRPSRRAVSQRLFQKQPEQLNKITTNAKAGGSAGNLGYHRSPIKNADVVKKEIRVFKDKGELQPYSTLPMPIQIFKSKSKTSRLTSKPIFIYGVSQAVINHHQRWDDIETQDYDYGPPRCSSHPELYF